MNYPIKPVTPLINRRLAKLYGVVAAWPFAERGGATVRDILAGESCAITGTPVWTNSPLGSALVLDGSTNYLTRSTTGIPALGAAWSVSGWIQPTGTGGTVLSFNSSSGNRACLQAMDGGGGSYFIFTDGVNNGDNTTVALADFPAFGQWSHFAITYAGNGTKTFRYFLNGSERPTKISGTNSNAPAFSNALAVSLTGTLSGVQVGRRGDIGFQFFPGGIAGMQVSNRDLSASQIAALYLDPWALYRPDKRNLFAVSSSVLFRRSLSARAGSRSLSI